MSAQERLQATARDGGSVDVAGALIDHLDLWTGAITKKSSSGRGSNGKIELTGIKKLRELILELAVRGKLVEQNPTDEPACLLLKQIAAEKKQLTKEGKLKKQKKLSLISDEETPFNLPNGWAWARLGALGWITSSSRVHQKDWVNDGVPFFRAREIVQLSKLGHVNNELFISEKLFGELTDGGTTPSKNDIMLTGVGTIGVPYLVKASDRFYFKDASVLIFKNISQIYPDYLLRFFKSPSWINAIHDGSMGTTVHTLTIARANEVLVPLAPLAEQHRIVQKVDELMALCDRLEQQTSDQLEAHETLVDTLLGTLTQSENAAELADSWARLAAHFDTLFTTEQSVDKLKQTILQLAVMGRLVEQDAEDEPVSDLLNRIEKEKAEFIRSGKLKSKKAPAPVNDEEKPYSLPANWTWVRLGRIAETHTGFAFKSREYTTEGTFVLRVTNINQDGTIDTSDAKYISQVAAETTYSKFQLKDNDILLVMVGGSLGKIGVVDSQVLPAVLNQNMWKFQLFGSTSRDYFVYGLKHINENQVVVTSSTHGHLSQSSYLSKLFPLPPLEEQQRIVQKVDELMALCDQLKERLNQASETRCQLAEAVVEGALS
ncbi:restriction endonuclease subunit S [Marinobacterium weihaiense]|uniref:Restriction endonuclease subunit S n=1 Tax=Marinobacterium weihaiense TaxID=2851016 RepID=A0ABS6MA88_9GAMM|nr:restriction endonuclease subunit S [Marinobacterium weihaiense]MBV0933198.1 restriction endonuclease subunit S [Marinobacterium weihaiense]